MKTYIIPPDLLQKGRIIEQEARESRYIGHMEVKGKFGWASIGPPWFLSEEEAKAYAEEQRENAIFYCKKRIATLKKLKFKVVKKRHYGSN